MNRIILYGTFDNIAYPDAMAWELKQANCKFIDYTKGFANKLPLKIRDHGEDLTAREGITIEYVNTYDRKESLIAKVLKPYSSSKLFINVCLNGYAERLCACYLRWPVVHWSLSEVEYATDIVFKSTQILPTLYKELVRGAVGEIEAADVYCFMGKRLTKASADEVSSRF